MSSADNDGPIWRHGLDWGGFDFSSLPEHADAVIVGSGLSGLSAALHLARAGYSVVVLDAGEIADGASSRSGGMAGPSFFKLGLEGLGKRYGEDAAVRIMAESLSGFNWLLDFLKEERLDCDLVQAGRFRGARTEAGVFALKEHAEYVAEHFEWPIIEVPQNEVRDYIGTDVYKGGIFYRNDATLHPGKFAHGLVERVVDAGGKLVSHCRATEIRRSRGGFIVDAGQRQIKCQAVLIATNGYSGPLFPFFEKRVVPIRSAIIATEVLPPSIVDDCLRVGRAYGESNRVVSYFRASADGRRVLFGGRAIEWNRDNPKEYRPHLEKRMRSIFPQLSGYAVESSWSGRIAYTFDHIPHLGEHEGIFYVGGCCGSGVARAPYFGRLAARMMMGHPRETIFSELPMIARPFYNGKPWFLSTILRWNEFRDRC